jgi:hypothetical protein
MSHSTKLSSPCARSQDSVRCEQDIDRTEGPRTARWQPLAGRTTDIVHDAARPQAQSAVRRTLTGSRSSCMTHSRQNAAPCPARCVDDCAGQNLGDVGTFNERFGTSRRVTMFRNALAAVAARDACRVHLNPADGIRDRFIGDASDPSSYHSIFDSRELVHAHKRHCTTF